MCWVSPTQTKPSTTNLEPKNLKNQQRDWVTEVLANFFKNLHSFLSFKPKSCEIFICWKSFGLDPINLHHCLGKFSKKWLKIRWEIYLLFNKQNSWICHLACIWNLTMKKQWLILACCLNQIFKTNFVTSRCDLTSFYFPDFVYFCQLLLSLCFRGEQHWFFYLFLRCIQRRWFDFYRFAFRLGLIEEFFYVSPVLLLFSIFLFSIV